jgi:hypothetical protein
MARKTEPSPARRRGRQRRQPPSEPGDPDVAWTFKMPGSLWARLRTLALRRGSTSVGELRIALERHLARFKA